MSSEPQKILGILAGAGEFSRLMAEGARRAGCRIIGVGFRGAEEADFIALCDEYTRCRVGELDAPAAFFHQHAVTDCVLVGQIKPSCIYTMWPDASARRILATLDRRNAHTIFTAICHFIAGHGIRVLPSTTFMEDYMPSEGHIAGPPISEKLFQHAHRGMRYARDIAALDIGQCLVMQGEKVLCVEGYKGTNECVAQSAKSPLLDEKILCKITKSGHDMRFDVPCIGLSTLRHCHQAGIKTIAIEADKTIMFQAEKIKSFCDEKGISLLALPRPEEEDETNLRLPEGLNDKEHAQQLARILTARGIGQSAIVCDGVVITVGDMQGVEKAIQRASTYMRKLRLARLINGILHFLLRFKKSGKTAPILLSSTEPLNAAQLKAARKAHIIVAE